MNELPLKWECVDISTFLYPVPTGVKPFIGKRKYYSTGSINGKAYLNEGEYTFKEKPARANRMAEEGDVLQARMQGTDKVLLVDKSLSGQLFSTGFLQFRIIEKTYANKLLLFFMKSDYFLKQRDEFATGSTQIALTDKGLSNIKLLVPPLNEQRRIAAKLEKILHRVDACKERLDKIPSILKRFRQSVLAAACSGRLTSDWREQNPNLQPSASLIKEERFQVNEPEGELPELPDMWQWVALGNYGQCFRGRFSVRPRNDPRFFGGKHPFIQIGNLPSEGGWIKAHTQTLNDKGLAVSKKFPKGIAVIAIVGATIGNTGLLAYDMCFTDSMVGIDTGSEEGNRYVELFLRSKKNEIRQTSYSSGGQPNIKLEGLNPYPLALPPLPEQQEIVRRVEALFKKADAIEERHKKAKVFVDKLTQSILAKAFRGELVAQDPNDEPASVLLERIRAEKEKTQKKVVSIKDRMKKKYKPFIPSDLPMVAEEKTAYGKSRKKKKRRQYPE